jgi:hypothetical protein
MSDIQLNFINESNDRNNSNVVIFQKNVATTFEEVAVAWKVIQNCGQGFHHPFSYPMTMDVAVSDSMGNYSPKKPAQNGELFTFSLNQSGDSLQRTGAAAGANEIDVLNGLELGAINVSVYKAGKVLAIKTAVAPKQKAVFEFLPSIFIGVVSQVQEGEVMNSAVLSNINTQISLLGIASADIVMTGGGPGPTSSAFQFALENVKYA